LFILIIKPIIDCFLLHLSLTALVINERERGAILMLNDCPPIFPEITSQEEQIEYITTIVNCETEKNNILLVKYFAEGMTNYLRKKIN
jgi:hypothetical protein